MADLLKRLKISEQQYGVGMEDALVVVVVDHLLPLLLKQSPNKQVIYLHIFNHILNDYLKELKVLQQNHFKDMKVND
jgi:hypothetical protein